MSLRGRIKRWLYGSMPGFAGSFPYFGVRIFFPPRSLIFYRACREGIFESAVLRKILALTRPGTTCLDIGANIGLMSVPVLASISNVQVFSFEPSPANLDCLRRTARHSRFRERWKILGQAVAEQSGRSEFFTFRSTGGAMDGLRDTRRAGTSTSVIVDTLTIDDFWRAQQTPQVSCIKIDVEGAELAVLRGARDCLAEERPAVILEWNATNLAAYECAPEALLVFAQENGLDVMSITPFCGISSAAQLSLAMQHGENFLLLPK